MKRVLWWAAVAAYACWVLSPWGWVDLISLIGLALGGAITGVAIQPTEGDGQPLRLTERFWHLLIAVVVCGSIGYGFYGPSSPRGRAAMLFGVVAGVVLTAGYYSSRETRA